ncbi:MAG: UDP-N-acetylmuramoyl-L-alanyl-D-glutamate--2,6-diaminopimelate ligase, partial [Casimicrobiaceae bacterium]
LVADSRLIQPGDVFVARRGSSVDGHDFIAAAVERGAAAVVAETAPVGLAVPVFQAQTADPAVLAELCNTHYGWPSRTLRLIGVTGTNGKTSVVQWVGAALAAHGSLSATVGTLGVSFAGLQQATDHTTPDLLTLYRVLADLRARGARHVAMEVSSHALDQRRVAGLEFACAVFTNLTPDHLDYHGTMEAYGRAKARLFEDYPVLTRIINVDDPFGRTLAARLAPTVVRYGIEAGDVRAEGIHVHASGQRFRITGLRSPIEVDTPAVGRFNVLNLLAVACVLHAEGVPAGRIGPLLAGLPPVPGRMQRVGKPGAGDGLDVFVDYAHTPDALAKALATLRLQTRGRLWVVFGCGGGRDRSKRPAMGRIAAETADRVVITHDNPRFEPPEAIIAEMVSGIPADAMTRVTVEQDRAAAIELAIAQAEAADTVLIAGTGHERYQEVAGERRHFDDVEVARQALAKRAVARRTHHV